MRKFSCGETNTASPSAAGGTPASRAASTGRPCSRRYMPRASGPRDPSTTTGSAIVHLPARACGCLRDRVVDDRAVGFLDLDLPAHVGHQLFALAVDTVVLAVFEQLRIAALMRD